MEWISVKDKLPQEGQEVLCFQEDGIGALMSIYGDEVFNVQKYPNLGDRSFRSFWASVTHWMPLPEPPKTD